MPHDAGRLYVVGTPIGNLEDISLRALRILQEADLIAAEDTRRARKLLSHYDIHTPTTSYHEYNKRSKTPQLISKMKQGTEVALVSDAGMPGISDPGHDLITSALQEQIEVVAVPGPSAIITALLLSGLPTGTFRFVGFAPRKRGGRTRYLEKVLADEGTSILFEAPGRLLPLLEEIVRLCPTRRIAVARELTKKFEQVLRGTAREIADHFKEQKPRGECVIVIQGSTEPRQPMHRDARPDASQLVENLMREEGMSKKDAMRKAATQLGVSRREIYRMLLDDKQEG
jgi:16S rRNA (cytidine1402-2'-O)-methyltransferase